MGGHGHFVWPAYIVSALVVGGLVFAIRARARALSKRLREHEGRKS